jgi:hypothetical protein
MDGVKHGRTLLAGKQAAPQAGEAAGKTIAKVSGVEVEPVAEQITPDLEILYAQIKRLTREARMLRRELMNRYTDAAGACPMCMARRERIGRYNRQYRAKNALSR